MKEEKNPAITKLIEKATERTSHPFFFYENVKSIPECIKECLSEDGWRKISDIAAVIHKKNIKRIFLGGSGTSLNACNVIGKAFYQQLGIACFVDNPFESMLYPPSDFSSNDVMILISHSGNTLVNRQLAEKAKESGVFILAITDNPDALIIPLADATLIGPGGREIPIPKSRSYVTAMVLGLMLVAAISKIDGKDELKRQLADLPRLAQAAIDASEQDIKKIVADWGKIEKYFISGINMNTISGKEFALKLLEMICIPSMSFEMEEFCHGPELALNRKSAAIFLLAGEGGLKRVMDGVNASNLIGTKTAIITNSPSIQWPEATKVVRIPNTSETISPVLMILPAQLFAYYTALNLKINPDVGGAIDPKVKEATGLIHPKGTH